MFHQGDLQSGIALAIAESKSVVCFIRDENEQSIVWEELWLESVEISELLAAKAVTLRIQTGSREEGFLSAFCPLQGAPSLVVIHNGQLRANISPGASREDFISLLHQALGEEPPTGSGSIQPSPPSRGTQDASDSIAASQPSLQSSPTVSALPAEPVVAPPVPSRPARPARPAVLPPVSPPISSSPSTTAQALREEREASIKAKGKRRAEPEPEPSNTNTSTARGDWLAQQRQRQSEARTEKERILAQIEADKAERKARREEEKRERLHKEQGVGEDSAPWTQQSKISNAAFTKLQVRLLDGGTIREQFLSSATLDDSVRPWIDIHLEMKAPYTFKQILAPQPAKSISISEEQQTLKDLGLSPSATLVLQPISEYTDAYASSGGSLLASPYHLAIGAYGLVSGTVGGAARWLRGGTYDEPGPDGQILGDGQEQAPQASAQTSTPAANGPATTGGTRVRTLADQRADRGEDQQFYNGNSLDFQPDDR